MNVNLGRFTFTAKVGWRYFWKKKSAQRALKNFRLSIYHKSYSGSTGPPRGLVPREAHYHRGIPESYPGGPRSYTKGLHYTQSAHPCTPFLQIFDLIEYLVQVVEV